ncbi:MAG: cyclic nucleotide-binding domain-containing protein [Gammaproteobacteria bacterium]|nr:cyclic nucleotide-binding domain-containing protein [Gammaproteobacteria bacterium]
MLTQVQPNHLVHECNVCEPRGGCLGMVLLNSEEAHQQLSHAKRISRKAEHVFREGEDADCFYVVRSGSVKSYLVTEDGEEQVLGFYLPGDVFGMDVTESQHRMSSAITLETTSVCRFPHAFLSARAQGVNLLKITAEQMQRDHNLVLMLARKDADGRIAGFLDDLACRYWSRGYSSTAFLLTMSRQDIGCYLGLAVETVSRTLTRFQECGVLRVNRREVEILDHDTLRKIAGTRISSISPDCCKTVELKSV